MCVLFQFLSSMFFCLVFCVIFNRFVYLDKIVSEYWQLNRFVHRFRKEHAKIIRDVGARFFACDVARFAPKGAVHMFATLAQFPVPSHNLVRFRTVNTSSHQHVGGTIPSLFQYLLLDLTSELTTQLPIIYNSKIYDLLPGKKQQN